MEEYNPNAVWTSKKKKVVYTPPEPLHLAQTAPDGSGGAPSPAHAGGSGKKAAIIAIVVVVLLAAAGGAWFLLNRPVVAPAVGLDFASENQIAAGATTTFSVLYTNSSTVALRNTSLVISLPDGVFFSGQPDSERTATIALGDVAAGAAGKEDVTILGTSAAGSVVQVSSTLSYATDASRGVLFTTSKESSLAIGTPVIDLAISPPSNVFAGQDFTTKVSYENATDHPIDGVKITMQYPDGFAFTEASPIPAFPGDTIWNIGTVPAGGGGTILITGSMTGKNTALYSLSGTAAESIAGTSYPVAAVAANVSITATPLTIGAVVNSTPDYVAELDDNLDYKITYANLSNTTFQNVAITATFAGAMFDQSSVDSAGAYNSLTNTLTWYTANTPSLASVAPGEKGSVEFRIKTKPSFPIASAADKDFALGLHLAISSPTVPAGTAASSTSASMDVTNKVSGAIAIDAAGYRYEPGSGIANSGPYPPQVNQETLYTVHWRVTDYSTDVSGVGVSAYLQSGATCTGKVMSTIAAVPVCNAATGEVTWDIPSISAGTGILGAPAEAVFQVENMPAANQVGKVVTLLGKTSLTATDEFTGGALTASANSVGTDIPEDTAVTTNERNVTK
jgi:hypothetical protein